MSSRDRLIVALDFSSADAGARMAERLRGRIGMFKVGAEVFTAEGPVLARYLVARGERVFLDLKFHDIPNTVRSAAREAAELGASMLNVHALGGRKMMAAALQGAHAAGTAARPRVLAVTLLTSHGSDDLEELGITGRSPEEVVVRLARLAQRAGLDGVVASPKEVVALRRACGPRFVIVTPGIRPAEGPATVVDDQVRIATPESAIQAGADYIVVGRPITGAADPEAAAEAIVAEMDKAASRAPAAKP